LNKDKQKQAVEKQKAEERKHGWELDNNLTHVGQDLHAEDGKPYQPGKPIVERVLGDDTCVKLSWEEADNNNSEIKHYILEQMEWQDSRGGAKWKACNPKQCKAATVQVTQLNPRCTYVFRVRAKNAKGDGPWGSESQEFQLKPPAPGKKRKADAEQSGGKRAKNSKPQVFEPFELELDGTFEPVVVIKEHTDGTVDISIKGGASRKGVNLSEENHRTSDLGKLVGAQVAVGGKAGTVTAYREKDRKHTVEFVEGSKKGKLVCLSAAPCWEFRR